MAGIEGWNIGIFSLFRMELVINMHEKSLQGIEIEDLSICPECGSRDLTKSDDETYCNRCGFVID